MVIHVFAYVVQIIVLASSTDALLTVDSALQVGHGLAWVALTQKQRFKLVHASVGEKQRRVIVRHARGACPKRVAVLFMCTSNPRFRQALDQAWWWLAWKQQPIK